MKAIEVMQGMVKSLEDTRARRLAYMQDLIAEGDWHGVMDASADIRVKQAQALAYEHAISLVTKVEPVANEIERLATMLERYGADRLVGEPSVEAKVLAARVLDLIEKVREIYHPGKAP